MKRVAIFSLAVLACLLLFGCGKESKNYDVQESTVFIEKDGTVTSVDVEDFDEDTYDKAGLESYVRDSIDEYNGENGEEPVKLDDLTVEDGVASLRLTFATADDYADFTGIELYTGSVAQALAQGYLFDVDFASVTDSGKAASCSVNDFLGGDYSVVIIKGNTDVRVDGTIDYLSVENTSWVDKSTVAISDGTYLIGDGDSAAGDEETEETEDTEAAEVTIDGTESEDSVDEDDLLLLEEDTEVVFEFDDDDADETDSAAVSGSEVSNVYTYIIYK